jgi:hypothetical protein
MPPHQPAGAFLISLAAPSPLLTHSSWVIFVAPGRPLWVAVQNPWLASLILSI